MNYKFILLDIDDTVLDYKTAEKKAFIKTHLDNDVNYTEEDYITYHNINAGLWKQLEKGLITANEIIETRYKLYFEARKIQGMAEKFSYEYEENLSQNADVFDDGIFETLDFLKRRAKIYSITNGTYKVQTNRVRLSGVENYLDGCFISEKLGHRKPSKEFFDIVEKSIPNFNKESALVVGDSLSADIAAVNFGFHTCFIDRKGIEIPKDKPQPEFVINKFYELKKFYTE